MCYQLAPFPTSLVDETGNMRDAKSKASLKNELKIEKSSRLAENDVDIEFLDGCALLCVVPWPTAGTIQDYLDRFRTYLCSHLVRCDVHLVFDQ